VSSPQRASGAGRRTVSLVTLGCARNEVDSEELAGRLEASGWTLTDRDEAAVVLVNTCGFIEAAKQESIAELLDGGRPGAQVVAAGTSRGVTRETWKWSALAALALLVLEWVFYHRRIFY